MSNDVKTNLKISSNTQYSSC